MQSSHSIVHPAISDIILSHSSIEDTLFLNLSISKHSSRSISKMCFAVSTPQSLRTLTSAIASDCARRLETFALDEFSVVWGHFNTSADAKDAVVFIFGAVPAIFLQVLVL